MHHDISRLAYRLPFENGMEGREKVFAGKEVSTTDFGDCIRTIADLHLKGTLQGNFGPRHDSVFSGNY